MENKLTRPNGRGIPSDKFDSAKAPASLEHRSSPWQSQRGRAIGENKERGISFKLIFKNASWLGITEIFSKLIGFLVVVWIARYFGPEIYGKWAFAMSLVIILSVFSDFGLSVLTVRDIARDKTKTKKYLDNIITLKIILGLVTFFLIYLFGYFLSNDETVIRLTHFLGIYIIINTFAGFFESIFRANEKMQYEAFCRISQGASLLFLVGYCIINDFPILSIGYSYIGAVSVGSLLTVVFLRRYFTNFSFAFDRKFIKKILSESWPFGLSVVAILLYNYFDQVMIGVIKGSSEVGFYSAAFKIIIALSVVGDVIGIVFFPQLSRAYKNSLKKLEKSVNQFLRVIYFFALPFTVGALTLSNQIFNFLYGLDYNYGILSFKILVAGLIFLFISVALGEILKSSDRQKVYLRGLMAGMILNIVLNFILIPSMGINGAAIATFFAQIFIFSYMFLRVRELIKIDLFSGFFISLISSLIMGVFIYPFLSLNLILVVSLGIVVYFIFYFLFLRLLSIKFL